MHLLEPTGFQISKIKRHHGHTIDRPRLPSEPYAKQIHHIHRSQQHCHTVTAVVVHHTQGGGTAEFAGLFAVAVVKGLIKGNREIMREYLYEGIYEGIYMRKIYMREIKRKIKRKIKREYLYEEIYEENLNGKYMREI